MRWYFRWAGLLAAVVPLVIGSVQVAAAATTSAQGVAFLNAQRAANGIPAGISELSDWDAGCQSHDNWMYLNRVVQHDEVPGTPGYTDAGAAFGPVSVLAQGDWVPSNSYPWGAQSPWEDAPIHLMDTLEPWLMFTGFADYGGYACEVTHTTPLPTGNQVVQRWPASPELLTYPGNGTNFIPPSEVASEEPVTPGEAVGIPAGTQTGPYLLIFAWGAPPGRITSASLRGPDGPVNIVTADNETSGPGNLAGIGMDMPSGGVIIPRSPLSPTPPTRQASPLRRSTRIHSIRPSFLGSTTPFR